MSGTKSGRPSIDQLMDDLQRARSPEELYRLADDTALQVPNPLDLDGTFSDAHSARVLLCAVYAGPAQLREGLARHDRQLQGAALELASKLVPPAALEVALGCVQHATPDERDASDECDEDLWRRSCFLLGRSPDDRALAALLAALDAGVAIPYAAFEPRAHPRLCQELCVRLQRRAALDPDLDDALAEELLELFRVVGLLHDERALPVLAQLCGHQHPKLRAASAAALGELGGAPAMEALLPLLDDPSEEVREEVVRAVFRVRPTGAFQLLEARVSPGRPGHDLELGRHVLACLIYDAEARRHGWAGEATGASRDPRWHELARRWSQVPQLHEAAASFLDLVAR